MTDPLYVPAPFTFHVTIATANPDAAERLRELLTVQSVGLDNEKKSWETGIDILQLAGVDDELPTHIWSSHF